MTRPSSYNRRDFLGASARNAAGVAVGALSLGMASSSREPIRIGLIGVGQHGQELARIFAERTDVNITAICDVDVRHAALTQHELAQGHARPPLIVTEHEAVLERSDVDAVVICTPDHWHARIAVDACRAGKDIYLEQPVGLSISDGEAIRQAAHQYQCVVQTGLPQRSGAHFQSAVSAIQRGEIGSVHLAKAWAVHRRRTIGNSRSTAPPHGVDYDRWLGPAPTREFQSNRFHQHWPWFWDYGAGELGCWGVQLLDVVRWGLNLDLPQRVSAGGGIFALRDDRDTPDTLQVQFDYGTVQVMWEHRQWSSRGIEGRTAAAAFYGDEGTLVIDRGGWKIYDRKEALVADSSEFRRAHVDDFLQSVRQRTQPAASIDIGARSMALCHLGNIAYRLGRELRFDANEMQFLNDPAANEFLATPPRKPWQVSPIS